jgi:23S rRNA pseudouridine1911/1915/1917 synthase
VWEDADVVVVDKPPGLVVHPGAGQGEGTLVNGLLARHPELAGVGEAHRPGIVHRLDRDTSGLLVVALTPAAYTALVIALGERRVERRYAALVWGVPEAPRGVIDAPIGRSPRQPTRQAVVAGGRPARTRYEMRVRYDQPADLALLGCRLETGRTHQIRVHLASIGHPVVGDREYGGQRDALSVPRVFLHAEHLAFDHPVTGEALAFDSPLPPDLAAVLAGLHGTADH